MDDIRDVTSSRAWHGHPSVIVLGLACTEYLSKPALHMARLELDQPWAEVPKPMTFQPLRCSMTLRTHVLESPRKEMHDVC